MEGRGKSKVEQVPASGHTGRRAVAALLVACAVWLALLYAFRSGFMEIEAEADPCFSDPLGGLCRVHKMLDLCIYELQLFGTAALELALLASLRLPRRWRRPLALAALFTALLALMLHNARYGAPAAVIALIALADLGVFRGVKAGARDTA
jgi:hypothetical protein